MKPKNWLRKVTKGFKAAFKDWKTASITLFISSSAFILLAIASTAGASVNMITAGAEYWIPAVNYGVIGLHLTGGWTKIGIVGIYSLLTGVAMTNLITKLRSTGSGFLGFSGILPGFLAAGCAGCGIGLLSFMGFTGALALLPFQGNLVRFAGLGLLIYFIGRIGNPKICSIPDE